MGKNALNLPVFTWKAIPDFKKQEKYAQYIISTNITYTHSHLHAHTHTQISVSTQKKI